MTQIALSPSLNLEELGAAYRAHGRLRIKNVLTTESAEAIATCIETDTEFSPIYADEKGFSIISTPADLALAQASIDAGARAGFQYSYDCYPMLEAYLEQRRPAHFLNRVLDFINSQSFLGLLRAVTGAGDIDRADAQASRYRAGHFLNLHDDIIPLHHRRVAYVLGMTREWRADWGGQLLFWGEDHRVIDGYTPAFNTLDIFTVGQWHTVAPVAPFVTGSRHAITGWGRAGPARPD
jgi:SM-20-related protein